MKKQSHFVAVWVGLLVVATACDGSPDSVNVGSAAGGVAGATAGGGSTGAVANVAGASAGKPGQGGGGAGGGPAQQAGEASGGQSDPGSVDVGPPAPDAPVAADGTLFVATDGDDAAGDGSSQNPFATPGRAFAAAGPGDVILVHGGQYDLVEHQTFRPGVSGTAAQPVTVMSFPGEWAVLDFGGAPEGKRVLMEGSHYNVVRDLEIANSQAQGIYIGSGSHHNVFVNVVVRDSNGSGVQIYEGSDNVFFECLVVFSGASAAVPGDADGMGSIGRGGPSERNAFYRCLAVDPPDDGFDSWEGSDTIMEGCWVLRAGTYGGNGNGFKAGPGPGAVNTIWQPIPPPDQRFQARGRLRRNVALGCSAVGFTSNSGALDEFDNNTAYACAADFEVYAVDENQAAVTNTLRNNLAVECDPGFRNNSIETSNSWNDPPGQALTASDFVSVDVPPTSAFVGLTGSEAYALLTTGPYADLLRLQVGSAAIDAGSDVGMPASGAAPDLGAFEAP